ncbi:sulfatase [Shewanella electrodiphila]|uniref:Sulfatase n=1 Tax=Shewanella electrodiphila TaxID=934143 RepID=A0ABT0KND0_9GAMM|nr:sulfatase [Shewanella electrodiphila]MCL1045041.1 sulfatase [Shewanella electrodiphila]
MDCHHKFSNIISATSISLIMSLLPGCSFAEVTPSEPLVSEKTPSDRPNIIFIMSDDHAYQAISSYGSTLINTPNIDRIANEGMRFTNASVTNSICAPSRATILTGKHTHINGKIDNQMPFDDSQETFPQILQRHGYQTAMFGKLHFGNNPKGVDDFMILPGQGDYINPDFITNDGTVRKQGYVTDIITDETLSWLKDKRDDTKPFMLAYLHKAPHRSWWPRADKFAEFYEKEYPLPDTLFDDYSTRSSAAKTAEMTLRKHLLPVKDTKVSPDRYDPRYEPYVDAKDNISRFTKQYTQRATVQQKIEYEKVLSKIAKDYNENWPTMSEREKTIWKYQRYMQDYLATVSSVDDNIGRVLDYLEEVGLAENTIVVYTSDQGFYLGEHGWYDKRFAYQESMKTPLMVRWPAQIEANKVSDELVQNLDFAQTFLDAAGIEEPDDMQGQSFLPLLTGDEHKWQRNGVYYHYYEYPGAHAVKRHYAIMTKRYKLIHFYHDIDAWELYDLREDPSELNNLYGNASHKQVQDQLNQELDELRKQYKDSSELNEQLINKTAQWHKNKLKKVER